MNKLTSRFAKTITTALWVLFALMAINARAQVTIYYWDINGNTAGAGGPTPSGSWESAFWTTDFTGSSPTVNWVEGNFPVFSAGTDATGSYTITAGSDHTVAGMQLTNGCGITTVNGPGILSIAAGMQGFIGTNLTINAVLGGTGGFQSAGGNNIWLNGNNTFSGGCNLNGGNTYITNGNALGTGTISPTLGGASPTYSALYFNGGSPITLANNFAVNTAYAGIVMPFSANTPVTLNGNWSLTQDLYLRAAPAAADVSTNVYLNGVISGGNNVFFSANTIKSYFVLNTNNTYTGKTTIGASGGATTLLTVTNFNSYNSGSPPLSSSSLGRPTVDAVIDCGSGSGGAACGFNYVGAGETTDRGLNNINTPSGGMWFYANGTGPLAISGNITAVNSASARTLTIEGSSTALNTISGGITDGTSGGVINVTKDGTATWALTGANTFSGALTTQTGGTLVLGGTSVYTGNTTVSAGSTFKLAAVNAIPYGSGRGNLSIAAGAMFDLAGFNCTVNGGANCAGTIDNTSGTATLTIGNNGTAQSATYSSVIQNTAPGVLNLAANSGGTLQLTSAGNTYSGYTAVSNAVLQIIAENQLGATPVSLVANSIILDHNLGWNPGTGANANNYYLRLQTTAAVTLSATRGIYLSNSAGYGGGLGAQQNKTLTVNGPISGPGGLWLGGGTAGAGIGGVTLNNTGNTYSGGTYIVGGTLTLGASGALPSGTPLWMGVAASGSGTYLDMNGKSQTIGTLTGFATANGPHIKLTGALNIKQTANTTFYGYINSAGGSLTLDPASTGTLTLAVGPAANNYTGPTIINGGTLALSGTVSISSSTSITVGRGATFDVSGLTTALTLGTSQTLKAGGAGGASATIATASGEGLTLGASSPLQFTAYDGTRVPLTITGAGSLAIGTGNAVTVTTTTLLSSGSFKLVRIGSGNTTAVTGTPATSVTVNGSGAAGAGSLRVTAGELFLDIAPNLAPVTQMNIGPGSGGTFTISYSGGTGSQFVLLQTNNITAPLTNWTRLQTNTLSSSSFTITPGADPAEFYRVKSE